MIDLDAIDFEKEGGLVPVVCQDHLSGAVLIVAYANREAMALTVRTGELHLWSRTRGLWKKGETSGNVQRVVELRYDCDADSILARVLPTLPACHTGSESCFGTVASSGAILDRVDGVIGERMRAREAYPSAARAIESARTEPPAAGDNHESEHSPHQIDSEAPAPARSYTRKLLDDRNLRLKKIGEEAAELVAACADGDPRRAAEEAADLFYHALVAVRAAGGSLRDIETLLAARHAAG